MFEINDRLAVHGFDFNPDTYEFRKNTIEYITEKEYGFISNWKWLLTGEYFFDNRKDWVILDCRGLSDTEIEKPVISHYKTLIEQGNQILKNDYNVVCCCSAGQSRSNAIAIALLVSYFKMDYYDALGLVNVKNPICNIAMQHLDMVKKLCNVKLP